MWSLNKYFLIVFLFFEIIGEVKTQCLSSVNPIGGTESLLIQEKKSVFVNAFYKYGLGNQYFENDKHSDFNLIEKAYYNYLSLKIGYGLTKKFTIEGETGYYINKSQIYNLEPKYTLKGYGFTNLVLLGKLNLYKNNDKRIYFSIAAGPKIPYSRNFQEVDNVRLPIELQSSMGALGMVFNASFVKENSGRGLRFFVTNRFEINGENKCKYRQGTSVFTSFYISKHLMFNWIKGDWTAILQVRNEFRSKDKIDGRDKASSGGFLFYVVPQVNYVAFEKWNLSFMYDIPFYQNFNGIQLGAGIGMTFSISRTFGSY